MKSVLAVYSALLLASGACSAAEPDAAVPDAATRGVSGDYVLVQIDSTPLARWTRPAECFEVPSWSQYSLTDSTWTSVDSANVPTACGHEVQRDSGTFRLVGDTIQIFVRDTMIGVRGLVLLGRLRADSLLIWGAEFDPGDFLYVRRP